MTSTKAIAANQANAQKSRGPKTEAGKQRSSRNAIQHGLSTIARTNPKYLPQIEQIARAICSGDPNPLLYEQALIIAVNELLLRYVSEERAVLIEKWRDPLAIPPNSREAIRVAKRRLQQTKLANSEFFQLNHKLLARGEQIRTCLLSLVRSPDMSTRRYRPPQVRNEYDAMCKAMPELKRLQRYERRSWSRRKRAISVFAAIKAIGNRATFGVSD